MNNNDDHRPQNYAIAESMRLDIPELEKIIKLRKEQYDDAFDPETKRKIADYVDVLGHAIKVIRELLAQVKT